MNEEDEEEEEKSSDGGGIRNSRIDLTVEVG